MSTSKNLQRQHATFGAYLTNLREQNTHLSQAAAARELGLNTRQQLHNYEKGRTLPPGPLLINMAKLYKVAPEEVLAKAYWPQLILLPLVSIMDPERLSKDVIEALEEGLEEADRQEIAEYVEALLRKRSALVEMGLGHSAVNPEARSSSSPKSSQIGS